MSIITYNGESKVIKRICELLDTMTGISFVVVQTLPTTDIQTNVIYLVPKQSAEVDNIYDEYINTDGTSQGWELIGTTEIDLTNYVQFSDLSTVATSGDYDDLIDKPTITDDKVKQTNTTASGGYRVLLSKTASDTEETDGVLKSSALRLNPNTGNVYIDRSHTDTSVKNEFLQIGNSIADGNQGANAGSIILYGKDEYYGRFYDNNNRLTANRTYEPPNKSGVLMLDSDIDNAICNIWNFLRFPYYNASPRTTNGITFTVDSDGNIIANNTATGTATFNLRASGENFIMPRNATYKLSGCPSGGSDSKYRLRIGFQTSGGTNLDTYYDYGEGVTFQIPSTASRAYIQAQVLTGQTATNLTFRPKLERLSEWVDLGSQAKRTETTLTEQYSELMFEINYFGNGYINKIHILRDELTSNPLDFITFSYGVNNFEVIAWLDGNSIKFQYDSTNASDIVKLYAKA